MFFPYRYHFFDTPTHEKHDIMTRNQTGTDGAPFTVCNMVPRLVRKSKDCGGTLKRKGKQTEQYCRKACQRFTGCFFDHFHFFF
ncbi:MULTISPECIES: hypothetical protein [unclassified Neisseria]|uniref:hypothetical protein n=1 Tax=unclassified Neisseria TaxID=2623750 RepID=UPI001072519F|nr:MULTISPECIES: hypothetical protein [unclassified Neisseria]MBF0805074.1 hypothetical protein [Neisseria sp. 19428wB4_WF04]TFU38072.1 hypothetical protein E4T99_12600 [Neisseria sp. WF04]